MTRVGNSSLLERLLNFQPQCVPVLTGMLRVWKVSGEELVAIEQKDMRSDNIYTLKTLLRSMYGFPVHTQTLVLDGGSAEGITSGQ